MPRTKAVTGTTETVAKTRTRTKTKYVNMTIDQFLTALTNWEKEGEELRAVGANLQQKMKNAGVGNGIRSIESPYPSYPSSTAMTPVPTPANIGEQWETPTVSMIDPMQEQDQLQTNISNQLEQANRMIQQVAQPEPF